MSARQPLPRVALVWAKYNANHVDRAEALARHLAGRAVVEAVEIASTTDEYAQFAASGELGRARKITLFPGRSFQQVGRLRRAWVTLRAVMGCRVVAMGVPYNELEFVLIGWILRLLGKRVVLLALSKFDDHPRRAGVELVKSLLLSCFTDVLVPGPRSRDYYAFLGRPTISYGGNTVSVDRLAAIDPADTELPFECRDFFYVGRLIEKKNVAMLIRAFARYCAANPDSQRRLVIAGAGPCEADLRRLAQDLVPVDRVVFAGFLSGLPLSQALARSLGLVIVSASEQWGLVINEALALGRPVITTEAAGARDVLVRNLENGFVIENGSEDGLVRALGELGADEGQWRQMCAASQRRAELGDVAVFVAAMEAIVTARPGPPDPLLQRYGDAAYEWSGPVPDSFPR